MDHKENGYMHVGETIYAHAKCLKYGNQPIKFSHLPLDTSSFVRILLLAFAMLSIFFSEESLLCY